MIRRGTPRENPLGARMQAIVSLTRNTASQIGEGLSWLPVLHSGIAFSLWFCTVFQLTIPCVILLFVPFCEH